MNNNNLKSTTLLSQSERKPITNSTGYCSQDNLKRDRNTSTQSLALISLPDRQQCSVARIYVEQAKLYFQEQNWQKAIVACKNALECDSKTVEAYKILGNILKLKGNKAEALGVYARALTIDPNCAAIYANLGSFYAEQQNWQQAVEYYQQAVILDPDLAGAYRSLAQVWEELGDSVRALECFCQAVNLEPEILSSREYFNFGRELYQQGRVKEASIFYTHGVKLDPQAKSELAQLVKMLEELQEWQQAVIYYHQLISLEKDENPSTTEDRKPIKNLLAHSKLKSSRTNAKHSTVKRSPKLDSDRPLAISSSSNSVPKLLPTSSNPKLAIVKDSSEKSPIPSTIVPKIQGDRLPTATSWNNVGSLYAQRQQWLKAISCYQEAIELDPKLAKTYRNLARVYSKTGELRKAYLCCYKAYTLEPDKVKAAEYFSLAKNLLQQSEINKAIACLQRTVELQPDFKRAYLILGKLFEKAGKVEQAKSYYSKLDSN